MQSLFASGLFIPVLKSIVKLITDGLNKADIRKEKQYLYYLDMNLKGKKMPAVKQKSIKMADIRKKAQDLGLTVGKLKKAELIQVIQVTEGFTPCFGRSNGECSNTDCCFMTDCLKTRL